MGGPAAASSRPSRCRLASLSRGWRLRWSPGGRGGALAAPQRGQSPWKVGKGTLLGREGWGLPHWGGFGEARAPWQNDHMSPGGSPTET